MSTIAYVYIFNSKASKKYPLFFFKLDIFNLQNFLSQEKRSKKFFSLFLLILCR